jgi:hypothetical protein
MPDRDSARLCGADGGTRVGRIDRLKIETDPQPFGLFATEVTQGTILDSLDPTLFVQFGFTMSDQYELLH